MLMKLPWLSLVTVYADGLESAMYFFPLTDSVNYVYNLKVIYYIK